MSRIPTPVDIEDHRELPVSLLDLKEQCRVEHDDQDRLLLRALLSATNEAESYIGAPIMARSFDLVLDSFPSGGIELTNGPVRSITSISYYDSAGSLQVLAAENYYLLTSRPFPIVFLAPDQSWPDTQSRENAVTVRYVAGHAAKPSAVPAAIGQAIALRAATRYEMSEESGTGTVAWKIDDRLTFEALLNPFRNLHV